MLVEHQQPLLIHVILTQLAVADNTDEGGKNFQLSLML